MFDDPAFFNVWLEDASDYELALLYKEWLADECWFPPDFSLVDECWKRSIQLSDLEALLIPCPNDPT